MFQRCTCCSVNRAVTAATGQPQLRRRGQEGWLICRRKEKNWAARYEKKDAGTKDLERKQHWALLQAWIYGNIGPKQNNMEVSFHVGALTARHYYSNCWHLNEMWYNWVAQPLLQTTSIAVFKNDDGGEGDSFFPLMFWSCHTLCATCTLLGRTMGLLGGSKVPAAQPRKKYGALMAEAAKSGWRCRIKVSPMTHFSGSLSFSSPTMSVAFLSCGPLPLCFTYNDWDLFQPFYFFFLSWDLMMWHL